jgi:MFS family permease
VSTTLGQPSWYAYFDLSQDPTNPRYDFTNSVLGTMNGVFSAGGCFGALCVAWACDRLGRRSSILLASPVAVVGGALQGGAVHIAMFLVGRLLSGFAVG